jgi:signal transduction histidine kinase
VTVDSAGDDGGTIRLISEVGKGSVFTLILPLIEQGVMVSA